jgi:phosphate/sulfate permease
MARLKQDGQDAEADAVPEWQQDPAKAKVEQPFVSLLIVSALSVAFAHGGNDVGNAVGPFASILEIRRTGGFEEKPTIPFEAIIAGTVAFVVGIVTMGRLTISTVGTKITTLTPTRSFATQIGAAVAVLTSSALKLPVSTSHCLVGAVIGIGAAQSLTKSGSINWKVLSRIFLAWGITIPLAMFSALIVFLPAASMIKWDFNQ